MFFALVPVTVTEGAKGRALLELTLDATTEEMFHGWEIHECEKPYREFMIPAEVLNDRTRCTIRALTPDEEDAAYDAEPWNAFPPGEPERIYAELRKFDSSELELNPDGA